MANTVILRNPEDEIVTKWNKATVDSNHLFTLIYSKHGFSLLRIWDKREKITFERLRVTIRFRCGYYLQVYIGD